MSAETDVTQTSHGLPPLTDEQVAIVAALLSTVANRGVAQ